MGSLKGGWIVGKCIGLRERERVEKDCAWGLEAQKCAASSRAGNGQGEHFLLEGDHFLFGVCAAL